MIMWSTIPHEGAQCLCFVHQGRNARETRRTIVRTLCHIEGERETSGGCHTTPWPALIRPLTHFSSQLPHKCANSLRKATRLAIVIGDTTTGNVTLLATVTHRQPASLRSGDRGRGACIDTHTLDNTDIAPVSAWMEIS